MKDIPGTPRSATFVEAIPQSTHELFLRYKSLQEKRIKFENSDMYFPDLSEIRFFERERLNELLEILAKFADAQCLTKKDTL